MCGDRPGEPAPTVHRSPSVCSFLKWRRGLRRQARVIAPCDLGSIAVAGLQAVGLQLEHRDINLYKKAMTKAGIPRQTPRSFRGLAWTAPPAHRSIALHRFPCRSAGRPPRSSTTNEASHQE